MFPSSTEYFISPFSPKSLSVACNSKILVVVELYTPDFVSLSLPKGPSHYLTLSLFLTTKNLVRVLLQYKVYTCNELLLQLHNDTRLSAATSKHNAR